MGFFLSEEEKMNLIIGLSHPQPTTPPQTFYALPDGLGRCNSNNNKFATLSNIYLVWTTSGVRITLGYN